MKNTVLIMNNELEQMCFSAFLITFCGCYKEISIVVRLQAVNSRDSIPTVTTNLSVAHPVLNGTLIQPPSIPNGTEVEGASRINTSKRKVGVLSLLTYTNYAFRLNRSMYTSVDFFINVIQY
jgi:hypothetical protein